MKNLYSKFIAALLITISIILFTFILPGCSSGTNVPDVICDYGAVLCDVSTNLCAEIPGVPPQVCDYLNLACYNLNVICELRDTPDSIAFQNALSNIQFATEKLTEWKEKIQATR